MTVICPIRSTAIFRHKLTGTFVEPQSNYYRELQRTYRDFPGMLFLQYAIAQKSGAMTMYTLDCSSGRLPGWAQGVGTLSREQIRKFGDQIDNIESYIRADEVQCITVADLLGRAAHRDPDIIVVDAEGFDHAILSQFDFGRLSTKLVIYETESMTREDAADLAQRLEEAGLRSSKPIRTRSRCVGIPKRFAGKMRPKARPHSDGSPRFDDMRGVRPLSSPRLVAVSPRSVQSKRHASQGGR